MQNIGKNIRLLRTEKGISQERLAEQLFVSRQTVSNYETGRSRPDVDTLMRISEILETDVQNLLYGPQRPQRQAAETRRLAIMCIVLALTGALCELIKYAVREGVFRSHFWSSAMYSEFYLLRPCFLLALGWVILQGISLLPGVKIMPYRTNPGRKAVRGIISIYFLMAVIFCGTLLVFDYQSWQHDLSGSAEAFYRQFSVPVITQCLMFLGRHYRGMRVGAALLGAALWLTGGKLQEEALSLDEGTP